MRELRRCPFCGGEAYTTYEDCYGFYHDDYFVCCDKCGLQFGFTNQFESKDEAIEAWNRREPIEKIIERLINMARYNNDDMSCVCTCETAIDIIKEETNVSL